MNLDHETKELAALALRNAFWRDFSSLVNAYLDASEGLQELPDQTAIMLGELTSVFGVDDEAHDDRCKPRIWAYVPGRPAGVRFQTLLKALQCPGATKLEVQDNVVFEIRDGTWWYVGDKQ